MTSDDEAHLRERAAGLVADIAGILHEGGFAQQAACLGRSLEGAGAHVGSADDHGDSRPEQLGRRAAARHLNDALTAGRAGSMKPLVSALERIVTGLIWTQTQAYVASPPYGGFLDHYAHATLLAPAERVSLLQSTEVDSRLGLLLLGPHHTYPSHAHPADEIYLPLTPAQWSSSREGPGELRPPGSLLHHRPQQPHGVVTGDVPLLAVYLWTGDTSTSSRFLAPARS